MTQVIKADTHISHKVVVVTALLASFEAQGKLSQRSRVPIPLMGDSNDLIIEQWNG